MHAGLASLGTQGEILPKVRFYYAVKQGLLKHTTMTREILRVKDYDNIALITGRGKNTGTWQRQPMQADE